MGLDVRVHGVYGVDVPEEWEPRLKKLLGAAAEAVHRENRPDDWADFEPESWRELFFQNYGRLDGYLRQEGLGEWAAIRDALGAPPDAAPAFTGFGDSRLGRDETEPGKLLVGYGLFSFPREIPPGEWRWKPRWHVWAEGY